MKPSLSTGPLEVVAVDFTILEPASDGQENVLVVYDQIQTGIHTDQKSYTTAKFHPWEEFMKYGVHIIKYNNMLYIIKD